MQSLSDFSRRVASILCVVPLLAAPALACTGDCDGDGRVVVAELVHGVNIALGTATLDGCPDIDHGGDGLVGIDELIGAVDVALTGCPIPIISTVAGTGIAGLNEDGLSPTETHFYLPQDITLGPDGNLYILDWNNHRVRRIRDGVIETVAGTGELGDARDGPALGTQFNHPTNVTFDAQGRMLIAAWHNSKVKRLDFTTGLVENLAGTGARSFGGDGGPGNSALLDLPSSVAIDSNGNVLISDQANNRVRLLEPDGTIFTVAGTGAAGFAGDGGPATDAQLRAPRGQSAPPAGRIDIDRRNNHVYIADTGNNRIRMIDGAGFISTIAGTGEAGYAGDGGPATLAQLDTPSDVAVTSNGSVLVADTMNHVVRRILPDGTIETLAGTGGRGFAGDGGPADEARLDRPYGVAVGRGDTVYIADTHNHRVRQITGTSVEVPTPRLTPPPTIIPCTDEPGSICTYSGTGQTGFNGDGHDRLLTVLYWPFDIEFTPSGRRVVLDWNNHKVREILPDDTFVTILGTDFVGDGPADLSDLTPEGAPPLTVDLNHPTDVLELPNQDLLLMAWHNHKLREISAQDGRVRVIVGRGAGFAGDGGPVKDALLNQPPHSALDADGNLFLIDQRNQRIRVIRDFASLRGDAIIDTVVGTGTAGFNGDGDARTAQVNFPAGGNPEPSGGITVDLEGNLYFADSNNHRIRKVTFTSPDFTSGVVTTVGGTGTAGYSGDTGPASDAQINFPEDIEIGPDGALYFADTNNNRVRSIDLVTGTIDTVAGSGERGYAGDGGAALDAQLDRPFGLSFDASGNLYICDTFNSRIRKVVR